MQRPGLDVDNFMPKQPGTAPNTLLSGTILPRTRNYCIYYLVVLGADEWNYQQEQRTAWSLEFEGNMKDASSYEQPRGGVVSRGVAL